ncbi:hypothetical protein BC834DRAFT_954142 [Gloeopeniophorella convolvens]|nr:hypothetical protein BC834DRAFT_954142 [Gloeopeniophorella convolvens]
MAASSDINWTANGTVCNAQQFNSSHQPNPTITCLTHGQGIGLALTAEASFVSLSAVLVMFVLIWRNVRRYKKVLPNGDWKLLQVPSDIYMLALFGFDIIQALGGIFDVRWAHNGIVQTGSYCTAQGVVQQIGELGVALITLILTIHTFATALWRVGLQARGFAFGMVGLACLFIALWVGIGTGTHKNYEVPTPYWCWIGSRFSGERIAGEYIWLWIALFSSFIMYIPLYFWTEGRLSVDKDKWYKFHTHKHEQRIEYSQRRAALGMLAYPLAYSIIVLPLSIARWLLFSNKEVPSAATLFAVSMFNLSGAINVLLLLIIRPQLLLFTPPEVFVESEADLTHPIRDSAMFLGSAMYDQSPQPTAGGLGNDTTEQGWNPNLEESRNSVSLTHVSSRQRSEEM